MADTERTLRRVALVSGLNGWTMVVFGLLCVVATLALGGGWWALLAAGIGASGVMELVGRGKLKSGRPDAGRWLTFSQLWLLALIVLYGAYQLASFDAESVMKSVSSALDQQSLHEMGLDEAAAKDLVRKVYYTLYISVIGVGLLYQGGLCLYYWRKARKLRS